MKTNLTILVVVLFFMNVSQASEKYNIQNFNVKPENSAAVNKINLQKAIDWASDKGAALFVESSDEPYYIDGGIILKKNVSLIGVHGPTHRGTSHPTKKQPVGSVFAITDKENAFITVELGTQIKGIQFWYPEQTIKDPGKIIEYKPTIKVSHTSRTQGVFLSCLTFYGEYIAFDFNATVNHAFSIVPYTPTYFLIDREGYIITTDVGGGALHDIIEQIEELLNEGAS